MGSVLLGYYTTGTTVIVTCVEDGATILTTSTASLAAIPDAAMRPWFDHCVNFHRDYSTAQAPVSGGPYLANGGFETYAATPGEPASWTADGLATTTLAKETTLVHTTGGFSLKVTSEGDTAAEGVYQALTATAGESYVITAWGKATNDAASIPRLQLLNFTDTLVIDESIGIPGNTATIGLNWQPLSVAFTAVTGKTYRVRLLHKDSVTASKIVYWDDVTVAQVS